MRLTAVTTPWPSGTTPTFRENNPNNRERDAWALYEIAFNYHKMGKNATAMTFLDQLLQQYQEGDPGTFPRPRVSLLRS